MATPVLVPNLEWEYCREHNVVLYRCNPISCRLKHTGHQHGARICSARYPSHDVHGTGVRNATFNEKLYWDRRF